MSSQTSHIGRCPRCGATVGSPDVLIEYDREGDPEYYVECPGCLAVVHPERPSLSDA